MPTVCAGKLKLVGVIVRTARPQDAPVPVREWLQPSGTPEVRSIRPHRRPKNRSAAGEWNSSSLSLDKSWWWILRSNSPAPGVRVGAVCASAQHQRGPSAEIRPRFRHSASRRRQNFDFYRPVPVKPTVCNRRRLEGHSDRATGIDGQGASACNGLREVAAHHDGRIGRWSATSCPYSAG